MDLSEEIALTFANGLRAEVSVSMVDERGKELCIVGSGGSISAQNYHWHPEITLTHQNGETETFRAGAGRYLPEFDAAAGDIRDGRLESGLVPLQATSDVMRILDECRRQMGLRYEFETEKI